MINSTAQMRRIAWSLSALAGYVDALGFLMIGGFFVSFMSGNTTRLAIGVVEGGADWRIAAILILAFLLGVIGGSLIGRLSRRRHFAVLLAVTLLLLAAGISATSHLPVVASLALAAAMGAENATFERDGEVRIGLTYMTGTLVKAGQRMAGALVGEDKTAFVPHLGLWLSLLAGAIAGGFAFRYAGPLAIWPAVALSAVLCFMAARSLDRAAP